MDELKVAYIIQDLSLDTLRTIFGEIEPDPKGVTFASTHIVPGKEMPVVAVGFPHRVRSAIVPPEEAAPYVGSATLGVYKTSGRPIAPTWGDHWERVIIPASFYDMQIFPEGPFNGFALLPALADPASRNGRTFGFTMLFSDLNGLIRYDSAQARRWMLEHTRTVTQPHN